MKSFIKSLSLSVFIILMFSFIDAELISQCPMCKMSAESNLKNGGSAGAGLNKGILYILMMPYILVSSLAFLWWKNRRRLSDEIYNEPFSDN